MPRPLRIEYPGAWYHVMNRGAGRKKIYRRQEHFICFLDILGEAYNKFQSEIHAYCLMDNHYHLLIHTPLGNLSRAMRHIDGVYTQRYNKMQKIDGPLFRGRYKAILIQKDNYLLQLSRYIHLNAIKAKIVLRPEDYIWSSCRFYIKDSNPFFWLKTDVILNMISSNNQAGRYKNFMNQEIDKRTLEFYSKRNLSVIFGEDDFKQDMLKEIGIKQRKDSSTDFNLSQFFPSSESIILNCCKFYNVNRELVFKCQRGKENRVRMLVIYLHRKATQLTLAQICEIFSLNSHAAVTNIITRLEKKMRVDALYKNEVDLISEKLTCKMDKCHVNT